jgi:hypothetical protein
MAVSGDLEDLNSQNFLAGRQPASVDESDSEFLSQPFMVGIPYGVIA